jgi:hypothetical protein
MLWLPIDHRHIVEKHWTDQWDREIKGHCFPDSSKIGIALNIIPLQMVFRSKEKSLQVNS